MGELGKIGINHRWHHPFTEVIIAGVETTRVHAELHAVSAPCPDQVVVDLPLCYVAPLRVGLVIAADGGEWSV